MKHELAFVFPGQGSQFPGMGRDVAEKFPAARQTFSDIDAALGFSISQLCFEGPEEQLRLTANTQPAILAVSAAMHAVIREQSSRRPDVVAGHSLGEYSAIVAAGGLQPAAAARLVNARGRFMQEAVPPGEGAMAALIGPPLEEVQAICDAVSNGEVLSPANINGPGQIVIAGTKGAVDRAIEEARRRGIRKALLLPVSAPFHCALMKPAEDQLKPLLDEASILNLEMPLVSNVDASPIGTDHAIRNALARQVVSPVRWVDSIQRMIEMGVKRFVEIGPGSVLTGLIKRIDPSVGVFNVKDAVTLEEFLAESGA